jgi:[CysO sulfur-carrier protein]-S-L-cysteine hydrolase
VLSPNAVRSPSLQKNAGKLPALRNRGRVTLSLVPTALRISREILDAILDHARSIPDRESCGLLAGRSSVITHFYPTANASPTPATNYEIDSRDLFRIMRELRAAHLELLAIYHSHPTSENSPSPTDIARAYYPDTAYIIVSPRVEAANPIRAFEIRDGRVTEFSIETTSDAP